MLKLIQHVRRRNLGKLIKPRGTAGLRFGISTHAARRSVSGKGPHAVDVSSLDRRVVPLERKQRASGGGSSQPPRCRQPVRRRPSRRRRWRRRWTDSARATGSTKKEFKPSFSNQPAGHRAGGEDLAHCRLRAAQTSETIRFFSAALRGPSCEFPTCPAGKMG